MDEEGRMTNSELFTALAKAQAAANGVMKNARNDYAGYDYVSADGMVTQLRQALLANGLMFTRVGWDVTDTSVVNHFILVHGASGQRFAWDASIPVVETKGRPKDKAVLGAITTALSYTLRDLLLVARVDELEVDNRPNDDMMEQAPQPKPKANSSLLAKVQAEAASREGGDVWVTGCLTRASAIDGIRYKTLEDLPVKYLELMLSNGGQ